MLNPEQKKVLKLFHQAAKDIPAYQVFLKKHKIKSRKIKAWKDFQKIPLMDKKNYLRVYPYVDLFPKKKIPPIISMSSGSSGKPFYWPRGFDQEERGGKIHEIIFRNIFKIGSKRTLVIVCFSMGTWIAGTFTASCCRYIAQKSYNLSIATPGIEKEDALSILKDFAPNFETVILAGYPPFLMDIIDEANQRKINLKKLNLRLLFAGENFSEKWRDVIHEMASMPKTLDRSVSIYGTADADILGHETPLSVFLRKKANINRNFAEAFFGKISFIPTLVQYYPMEKFFESVNGKLIFTSAAGIPLIRYNIQDTGKLISYSEAMKLIREFGFEKEIKKRGLDKWKLPFLTLGGRKDVSVTFYALNIYPENIKSGLEDDFVSKYLSGKFIASTKSVNKGKNQKLIIKVELARNTEPTENIKELAEQIIFEHLLKLNIEYRKLYSSISKKALPQIELIPFGDPIFQVKKSKHGWVRR
ncbi:MAG: phenylacetate--CoA ligase family protein [Parcubacteria group bacterium]|nr:phenylacetate--CoA ligase family protein [Parcubacteria group bacterium]